MIYTQNNFRITVKEISDSVKGFINYSIVALAIVSFIYFLYWSIFSTDEFMYEHSRHLFEPLASFICGGLTGKEIYLNTCLIAFAAIIPMAFCYTLCDRLEEFLIKQHNKSQEHAQLKMIRRMQKEKASQYDVIRDYSICLSIDYDTDKHLSLETKRELNQMIFKKITNAIRMLNVEADVNVSEVLIVTSSSFEKYDLVNDTILNVLAKEQKLFKEKHGINIIPSTTTDAYTKQDIVMDDVKNRHLEIQSFNFKNRATSTAIFYKKYKHLNQQKYAGVPIGEYAYFDKNAKSKTYELNIVCKNLSQKIAAI